MTDFLRMTSICLGLFCAVITNIDAAELDIQHSQGRAPTDAADRDDWLAIMLMHQFSDEEVGLAFGISPAEAHSLIEKSDVERLRSRMSLAKPGNGKMVVLPYPGGRHPRIGFLEGAIDPQRETKVSIFAPWNDGGYLVVDLPEAVWHHVDGQRELLYLAHRHVPTIWDKQNIKLPVLEWRRNTESQLSLTRTFPNKVQMTSRIKVIDDGARMEFSIRNGSDQKLTGLHIQMCAMLKGLTGFAEQTNDNKIFSTSFSACRDKNRDRWVILGFDHCRRTWGNARCPCLHADPQVPDCDPGETQTVHGWVSFFEGSEVAAELKRLEAVAFKSFEAR